MPALGGREIPTWTYGAAAAVVAAGFFLYRSRRSAAAAAAAPAKAPTAAAMPTPVVPAASYGTGQNAGALQNLQTQIANLQASQAATAGSAAKVGGLTPTVENSELSGAGYYPKEDAPGGGRLAVVAGTGGRYQYVSDPTQRYNAFLQGFPLFYQPIPGVFQQVKDFSQIPATTPFFLKAA